LRSCGRGVRELLLRWFFFKKNTFPGAFSLPVESSRGTRTAFIGGLALPVGRDDFFPFFFPPFRSAFFPRWCVFGPAPYRSNRRILSFPQSRCLVAPFPFCSSRGVVHGGTRGLFATGTKLASPLPFFLLSSLVSGCFLRRGFLVLSFYDDRGETACGPSFLFIFRFPRSPFARIFPPSSFNVR